jgi:hypothetical protein
MPGGGSTYRRGGRPKGGLNKVTADVRKLAGVHTKAAIALLVAALNDAAQPMALRITAARELLDRGCGKPAQALTGPDGGPMVMKQVIHQELADE